jgi:hypothetical protein
VGALLEGANAKFGKPSHNPVSGLLSICCQTANYLAASVKKLLVVREPTGIMTSVKKGEGILPGIEFPANYGYSFLFSQRGTH